MFFGLTRRNLQPELLDQPGVPEDVHRSALKGLERVNLICGTGAIAWKAIEPLARRNDSRPLEVLDIACGGGDVLLDLQRRAARSGANVNLTGYDMSETAIAYARESSNHGIDFQVCDIFENFPPKRFDVVMCSLFLHHLDEKHAVKLLRIMSATARRLVLVNDLIRSDWGYAAAQIVLRLISCNRIVLADGPQSVAGAFKLPEVRRLLQVAEIPDATIRKIWPFRFLLSWSPQASELCELVADDRFPAIRVATP
ncbi:MAG: methyltransferase domain-containing protein [Planctomycetia bacterium]|nr:methyltransferase domain-containing protein [Planctomycetia bacterium]